MENFDQEEKVAILLSTLGDDVIEPALSKVDAEKADNIRVRLQQIKDQPPPTRDIESVIDDFERYFKFALDAANTNSYWTRLVRANKEEEEKEALKNSMYNPDGSLKTEEMEEFDGDPNQPIKRFKIFQPSEDEILDLKRLHPLQVAEALRGERPKTMAIVLKCMDKRANAAVIENLPKEYHGTLINLLVSESHTPPELQNRIIRTVVQKALTIEAPRNNDPDPLQSIVGVLRELPRQLRNSMLEHLRETDTEKAAKVQKMVFQFDDITNYDDKSVQKILAEVDKGQLVVALQTDSAEAKDAVLRNLSKRAKETLEEELELLGKQADDVVKEAQGVIAEVISRLDQGDQLEFK